MNVISLGYSWTGSSAITQLLSEYDSFSTYELRSFEHIILYTVNGLFDLEDALLMNNSLYHSDGAINNFKRAMMRLNENDFGWCGGYKRRYGKAFEEIVNNFTDQLVDYRASGYWDYDFDSKYSLKKQIRDILKRLLKRPVANDGRIVGFNKYNDGVINFSFVNEEEYYKAAKGFVNNYMRMVSQGSSQNGIFDQMMLPHNLYRAEHYFNDDTKFIIVDRDIRDIFVLMKYIAPKQFGSNQIFPTEVHEFCRVYKKYRAAERKIINTNIMRIEFEDLVYKYENTIKGIEDFLGINPNDHIKTKEFFNPSISIKNTQMFKINAEWADEIKIIEEEFPNRLYDFPFENIPIVEETSDPE